jgi:acyl-CoA synthetase (NDP forming)
VLDSTIAVDYNYTQNLVDDNLKLLKTFEDDLVNKTVGLMEKYNKPVVGVYLIADETSRTVNEIDGCKYKGVIFPTPERAVKALAKMHNYSQWLKESA